MVRVVPDLVEIQFAQCNVTKVAKDGITDLALLPAGAELAQLLAHEILVVEVGIGGAMFPSRVAATRYT